MKFFVDTAEIKDIKECQQMGLVDGVTTNPSLIAKSGRDFKEVIAEICSFVEGPVSAEVASLDYDSMMREGNVLRKIAKNVAVKVPLTVDGLARLQGASRPRAPWSMSPCASRPTRRCWRPRPERHSSRPSLVASMTSTLMAWS